MAEERVDLDRTFQISGSLAKGDGQWRPARFRDRLVAFGAQTPRIHLESQSDLVPCTIVGHWIGCAFYLFHVPDADAILTPRKNEVDVSAQHGTILIAQDSPANVGFVVDWPTPIDIVPTDEISFRSDGGPTELVELATTYILRRL